MPVADAPGHSGGCRDRQDDHQHHGGGLGLACDASGWFNLKGLLEAFSKTYKKRPFGARRMIS
eukprot:5320261-Alexandrium_andersonii.AAC.1